MTYDAAGSLRTGLSTRGWRTFCRSRIGSLHRVRAIAACQNRPRGYELAPRTRRLPCCAVWFRSHARVLRELRDGLCASATALGGGGDDAELIEFMHLLRFSILSCDPLVSTAAAGQKQPQLRESTALLVVAPDLAAGVLGGGQVVRARVLLARLFCDRSGRIALEVPPSDAKLPLNCRLLDGFVGTPPIYMSVNYYASFCGIGSTGASRFPDWVIVAVVLRVLEVTKIVATAPNLIPALRVGEILQSLHRDGWSSSITRTSAGRSRRNRLAAGSTLSSMLENAISVTLPSMKKTVVLSRSPVSRFTSTWSFS